MMDWARKSGLPGGEKLRHVDAWVDGIRLADVGPVLIQQVTETPPEMELAYGTRPGRPGRDVVTNRRRALRVTIDAVVRELYDLPRRTQAAEAIAKWARGSVLELSSRPGEFLRVINRAVPTLGQIRDYTAALKIEFEADEIPYWQSKSEITASETGATGSFGISIPGTAENIPVGFIFTPTGTLNNLTVSVGDTSITLSGLNIDGAVVVDYDEAGRIRIKTGNTSLLGYRTSLSSDYLAANGGSADITWSANVSGTLTVKARGWYA